MELLELCCPHDRRQSDFRCSVFPALARPAFLWVRQLTWLALPAVLLPLHTRADKDGNLTVRFDVLRFGDTSSKSIPLDDVRHCHLK